jgi:hypothetical protein
MDRIRFIFAGFGIFANTIYLHHSLIFPSKYLHKLHVKIRFDAKMIHVEANICFRANILFIFSHTSKYLLQNFRFEANFCKTLREFHIQANICLQILAYKGIFACKYSHTSKFLLSIASNYLGKPQLMFKLFENILYNLP